MLMNKVESLRPKSHRVRDSVIGFGLLGTQAGGIGLGLNANTSDVHADKSLTNRTPEQTITQAEIIISNEIGSNKPVDYAENTSANVCGAGIYDPVIYGNYIGYILYKGGPSGPEVKLCPKSEATFVSDGHIEPFNKLNIGQVVFAPANGDAWNLNYPIDPKSGTNIVDKYGRTPSIGSELPKS